MPATEGSQRFAKQQLIILSSLSSAAAEHFFWVKIQTRQNKLPHYLFAARIEGSVVIRDGRPKNYLLLSATPGGLHGFKHLPGRQFGKWHL